MNKDDYRFDSSWKEAQAAWTKAVRKMKYADKLQAFILQERVDRTRILCEEVAHVPAENLQRVFAACKHIGIPRIFIGKGELVGADDIRVKNVPFQSVGIWQLNELLSGGYHHGNGYAGGCGNGDQSQTNDAVLFLPRDCLDKAYDVETGKEIDIEPFKKRMVVSRHLTRKA